LKCIYIQHHNKKKLTLNNPKQITIELTPQALPAILPVQKTITKRQKRNLKKLVDSKTLFDKKLLGESYVLDFGSDTDVFQKITVIYDIIDNLDAEERKKLRTHSHK
jgi:hypothetical protein